MIIHVQDIRRRTDLTKLITAYTLQKKTGMAKMTMEKSTGDTPVSVA